MILITGSTGFLGRELLCRLLVHSPDSRFVLLVRPSQRASAFSKVKQLLSDLFESGSVSQYLDRIEVLSGDLTLEDFGVGEHRFEEIGSRISSIFHCGASTSLGDELLSARKVNVGGTQQVVRLALKAAARRKNFRLYHVSTAYVAGDTNCIVTPEQLNLNTGFKNAYEQSKAEAESLVRSVSDRVNTCIFRPSIIVGDSVSGQTSSFNVIYIPARYLIRGMFSVLPACPNTPCDVVPVDYVADAMVALASSNVAGGACFHLCAGVGREPTLTEVVDVIFRTFNKYRRKGLALFNAPMIVSPDVLSLAQNSIVTASSGVKKLERKIARQFMTFREILCLFPYMAVNPRFDISRTTAALDGVLLPAPLFSDYAERLFEYCVDTNWGKTHWTNPSQYQTWIHRLNSAV